MNKCYSSELLLFMPHESMNLNQSAHIPYTYLFRYVKKKNCVNMILGGGGGGGGVTSIHGPSLDSKNHRNQRNHSKFPVELWDTQMTRY